jgi:tetratricopeptide (TPR) repeat protein
MSLSWATGGILMAASSQAYRDAKSFLIARDFEAAIQLLSSVDDPTPEELCLLADAYMLSGSREGDGEAAEAAYRNAIQLYSLHHADHSQPTMVYRLWAAAAYNVGDEEELIQAKETGLKKSNDAWLIITHYQLKQFYDAPLAEKEELIDQALSISPDHEFARMLKAHLLASRREWKKSWELMCQSLQSPSRGREGHNGND